MAVSPKYQKQGTGSLLVQEGLYNAKQLGYEHVVVLGHQNFYPKFGVLNHLFLVPEEVFMVLELKEESLRGIQGKVV